MERIQKDTAESALFYKDEARKMDVIDLGNANARNSGLYNRSRHTNASRMVDMVGRLHADIFFQDRYMLYEAKTRSVLCQMVTSWS